MDTDRELTNKVDQLTIHVLIILIESMSRKQFTSMAMSSKGTATICYSLFIERTKKFRINVSSLSLARAHSLSFYTYVYSHQSGPYTLYISSSSSSSSFFLFSLLLLLLLLLLPMRQASLYSPFSLFVMSSPSSTSTSFLYTTSSNRATFIRIQQKNIDRKTHRHEKEKK